MTDQKKNETHGEQPTLPNKTQAIFVDPSLSDEDVADAMIAFLDKVAPLPASEDEPPKKE